MKLGTSNLKLSHEVAYEWNEHGQLASVKSLAGEFVYGYDESNPALLTKMTGPAHSVETSYEPHRNLITGVVNRAKGGIGILPMHRDGPSEPKPADPSLAKAPASPNPAPAADSEPSTKHEEPRTLSSYLYANDLLGRRETISQGGEAFGMLKLGENQVEVAYNDRSEVVGSVTRRGDIPVARHAYAYDAIRNRRSAASEVGGRKSEVSYEANSLNQYAEVKTLSVDSVNSVGRPVHDPDGNLVEDARHTYTWNADNNLIRVEAKDGSLRLDYLYGHQSRRTVRIETTNRGKDNESRRTTYYLYDDWNLLAELESSAGGGASEFGLRVSSFLTWGRDLSGSLQGAGGVGGLLAISQGEAQRYPAYDANGNIGQLIDGAGAIVAAYAYDPFGNVTEMAGAEASENPWRFSTKPVEAGTGWLYYGYRWYDAEIGRWVSRDPISSLGTRAWFVRLTERHNLLRIIFESALRLKGGVGSFFDFQTRKAELSTLTNRGVAELLSFDDYLFVENNSVRLVDILGLSPLTLLGAAAIADRVVAAIIGCVCGVTTDVMFSGNYAFCNEIGKGGTIEEAGNAAYNAIVGLTGKQISKDCAFGGLTTIAAMFFPSASMAAFWGGGIATLGALPVGCAMGYFDL